GEELRRRQWRTVDQGQEDNRDDVLVLADVTDFEVRFLDSERRWSDGWPTEEAMANLTQGARPDIPMPVGIEVTLEHERFGEMVRTFAIPDFDSSVAQGMVNAANAAGAETDTDEQEEDEGQPAEGVTQ
ncbi:MAG: type II secretion system protein GspJ, partial [Marinobacter sp.]|nr:type II secretion system protein GspJ [Marinobacter sp.]